MNASTVLFVPRDAGDAVIDWVTVNVSKVDFESICRGGVDPILPVLGLDIAARFEEQSHGQTGS